ncbi:MAG: hypothetical protein KatS3mg077_2997 [Candidatus Binatia bacterium]|nr:MAG: hypothetical protein KatS3mg077_2997 [Candidatus Binatia bacterium]
MNAFKRFVLGFAVGVGVMYWVLHHGESTWGEAWSWLNKNASTYRGDAAHERAREILGD